MGKMIDYSKPENNPFGKAPVAKSYTKKHDPLVWESMLGTVRAMGPQGEKYFDYDYAAAHEYAGTFTQYTDLRLCKVKDSWQGWPRKGQWALFGVKKTA